MRAEIAFIALGSNLGEREQYLALARARVAATPGCSLVAESAIEETEPFGPVTQGRFLNQMIAVRTTLTPRELLARLLEIEREAGRVRDVRWGPRTLDLDIVAYEHATVNDADLHVPHPGLADRDFWQRELTELQRVIDHRRAAASDET